MIFHCKIYGNAFYLSIVNGTYVVKNKASMSALVHKCIELSLGIPRNEMAESFIYFSR